jgi:hypothetical protein
MSTGYEMGGYDLGMDYPLRSLFFGLVLVLLAEATQLAPRSLNSGDLGVVRRTCFFFGTTRVIGLLHVFISLWIMSIWGSWAYGSHSISDFRWDCLFWSVLFGLAAIAAVVRALQKDDAILRGFGLTFFFIGLYTKFCEYFWNGLHKAVFFGVLAISFWAIGRWAESLWRMKLPCGTDGGGGKSSLTPTHRPGN